MSDSPRQALSPLWNAIEKVRPYAGTFLDSSIFIGAFFEDVLIGFAKLTVDETRTQAGLMHIVSMIQHRDKAPTNALIAQAVKSCAERHIPFLVYSNFAYGNKRRDGLSDFKERNGFQRVDIPRYYVPISRIGEVAFRMGLHHKLIDRLPEPLIEKLRNYRPVGITINCRCHMRKSNLETIRRSNWH